MNIQIYLISIIFLIQTISVYPMKQEYITENTVILRVSDGTITIPQYLLTAFPNIAKIPTQVIDIDKLFTSTHVKVTKNLMLGIIKLLKLYITPEGEKQIPNNMEVDDFFSFESTETISQLFDMLKMLHTDYFIIESAQKRLVKIQFPEDPNTNQNNFLYPLYDMQFLKTIQGMIEDLGSNFDPETVIPLLNITKWQLDQSRHLVELFLVDAAIPVQTHYIQRQRINEFLNTIDTRFLIDLALGLNYLDVAKIIIKQVCHEYVQRIKKIEVLTDQMTLSTKKVPLIDDLINGIDYGDGIAHLFIDPVLQVLKGMKSIIHMHQLPESHDFNIQAPITVSSSPYASIKNNIIIGKQDDQMVFYDIINNVSYPQAPSSCINPLVNNSSTAIAFRSDENDENIAIQNISKGGIQNFLLGGEYPECYCFGADDTELIVGYNAGSLAICNIQSRKMTEKYKDSMSKIDYIACHPFDNSMIGYVQNGNAYIIYPSESEGKLLARFGQRKLLRKYPQSEADKAYSIAYTPNGEHILVAYLTEKENNFELYCIQYSAKNFEFQQKSQEYLIKNTYGMDLHIYIQSNNMHYIIELEHSPQAAQRFILVGGINNSPLPLYGASKKNLTSLSGEIIKLVSVGTNTNSLELFSIQNQTNFRRDQDSRLKKLLQEHFSNKDHVFISCFSSDATFLYVRTIPTSINIFQLYDTCWINVFSFLQAHKFTLQELHQLYKNYETAMREGKISNMFFSENIPTLQNEIAKCVSPMHTLYIKMEQAKNKRIQTIKAAYETFKKIFLAPNQMELPKVTAENLQNPPYTGGALGSVMQQGRPQPSVQVPIARAGSEQITIQPEVPEAEIGQPTPTLGQRIWQGFTTIITAPFRAVRYIWANTVGQWFS